jgi:hypothetical protein
MIGATVIGAKGSGAGRNVGEAIGMLVDCSIGADVGLLESGMIAEQNWELVTFTKCRHCGNSLYEYFIFVTSEHPNVTVNTLFSPDTTQPSPPM